MSKPHTIRIDQENFDWLNSMAHTEQPLNGVLTDIRLGRTKSLSNLKQFAKNKGGNGDETKSRKAQ